MRDLTAERVREVLDYDPETGTFTWRVTRRGKACAGSVAGSKNSAGYWIIMVDGRRYYCHRLAWLYVYGEWPDGDLDHRDTHRDNNRIDNLRPATRYENHGNRRLAPSNTSGFKGASYSKSSGRWLAQITSHKKKFHLGFYATAEEAHQAYMAAAQKLFGEFARAA